VLVLLVLLALALLTISFRSPTSGALHDVQGYGASALRPFQVAADRVARPFRDAYNYVDGLTSAKAENAKLRAELKTWHELALANLAASKQNGTFKRMLHYEGGPTFPSGYRAVNASVISFPSGPFDNQLAISAGSHSGIVAYAPVVDAYGNLIGHVASAGPTTSRVMLISDPESAFAAVDLTTKVTGLVRDGQGNTLILDRVPKEASVRQGDVIVTEGTRNALYPDIYPYGVPVGQVISVGTSDIASFLTVQVAPFAQLGSLDSVAVLVRKP